MAEEDVVVVGVDDHLLDEPLLLPGAARLLSQHPSSHCVETSLILLVPGQAMRSGHQYITVNDGSAADELVVLVDGHCGPPVPFLCLNSSLDIRITSFSTTANVHIEVQPILHGVQPRRDVLKVFKRPRLTNSLKNCLPHLTALHLFCLK